jgi:hypothetical protein
VNPTPLLKRSIFQSVDTEAGSDQRERSLVRLEFFGMPGSEEQTAALVDVYLERAGTQARLAQMGCAPVARQCAPETGGSPRVTADSERAAR